MPACASCGHPGPGPGGAATHRCDPGVVAFFADRPVALAAWAELWRRVAEVGPVEVAATKSRVAFVQRIRFAWVHEATRSGIHVGFLLPHPVDSPRLRSGRRGDVWSHHVKVEEVDDELMAWLAEAYHAAA